MKQLLITGASGGIGQAVARLGAARGLEPIGVGRSIDRLQTALPGLRHIEADVTTESGVERLFATMETAGLSPQALVHCVGSSQAGALERTRLADFEQTLVTNLTSTFLVSRAFVATLRRRALGGSVVLFSSVVTRIGVAQHELIAAAKAGVEGFTLSAAASHAAHGIRFNAIAPGLTETPLTQRLLSSEVGRAAAMKQYPLLGINQPEDVADLALWLTSSASSRVTGQVIAVDGGFSSVRPLVR